MKLAASPSISRTNLLDTLRPRHMLMFVGRYIDVEEGSFRTTISTDVSRGESIVNVGTLASSIKFRVLTWVGALRVHDSAAIATR